MDEKIRRIVIVGGVAAGMKVASRLRRLDPEARITLVERGEKVSYGACALPYYVEGLFEDLEDVRRTPGGIVRNEAFFRKVKGFSYAPAPRLWPSTERGGGCAFAPSIPVARRMFPTTPSSSPPATGRSCRHCRGWSSKGFSP